MKSPLPARPSRIPRVVVVADALLLVFGVGFQVAAGGTQDIVVSLAFFAMITGLVLGLGLVGGLIVNRVPGNAVGWIFLASSMGMALAVAAYAWATLSHALYDNGLPGTVFAAWLNTWIAPPSLIALVVLVPLVFPGGRLLSPRWRWVALFAGIAIAGSTFGSATAPGPMDPFGIDNPLGVSLPHAIAEVLGVVNTAMGVVVFGLALVALVTRYRHGSPVERTQLRWFAFPAAVAIFLFGLSAMVPTGFVGDVAWIGAIATLATLPFAIGIAILRYRLYDIDLIVNRTALYATVSVVLIGVFLIGNVALQYIVSSLTGQRSELLAGALGVGVGLLFVPMRRWIRPLVDRVLPPRAELTLLFTDIVGSTETLVDIGDERWRALLGRYLAAVRADLARHGGHEVNTAGDAFFATFTRPLNGLLAARAIRSSVRELGLETRTGLHVGEVEMRGEQVSGLAVHTAARVMAAAGAGEIFVSDAMRGALAAADFDLHDRGSHALKGVPGEWQLYALEPGG
jgi:class 3 adenylate cyclase